MNRTIMLLLSAILPCATLLVMRSPVSGKDKTTSLQTSIKIRIASIFVEDQAKALTFYTETLGLQKKADIPLGEHRWLTVVSPEEPNGTELLLEPNAHPAAKTYQKAIFADKIPATSLFVDDLKLEFERLQGLGVEFTTKPTKMGQVSIAVLKDTCGNLIQLAQESQE